VGNNGRNVLSEDMRAVDLIPSGTNRRGFADLFGLDRFLNRTLSLSIKPQERLTRALLETFDALVQEKSKNGSLDPSIKGRYG